MIQTVQPETAIVPAKISHTIIMVSHGVVESNEPEPELSFEYRNPVAPVLRLERLRRVVPQFRAPPVTPVAA